ncbi:MAG TPA: hypothetical protein VKZ68_04880 [Ohtaekwangia sp.]|nr:hypothetical protein [Ohtaekwangia sp.]
MKSSVLPQTWERKRETRTAQNNGVTVLGLVGCLSVMIIACLVLSVKMYVDRTIR